MRGVLKCPYTYEPEAYERRMVHALLYELSSLLLTWWNPGLPECFGSSGIGEAHSGTAGPPQETGTTVQPAPAEGEGGQGESRREGEDLARWEGGERRERERERLSTTRDRAIAASKYGSYTLFGQTVVLHIACI